jgi:hypothetical protein
MQSRFCVSLLNSSGLTWPHPAVRTNLPCPNKGLDVVRLPDGRLLIAFNDSMRTRYAARRKLMLAVSENDGLTWRRVAVGPPSPTDGLFHKPFFSFCRECSFIFRDPKLKGLGCLGLGTSVLSVELGWMKER